MQDTFKEQNDYDPTESSMDVDSNKDMEVNDEEHFITEEEDDDEFVLGISMDNNNSSSEDENNNISSVETSKPKLCKKRKRALKVNEAK